jgi:hypothetical protein
LSAALALLSETLADIVIVVFDPKVIVGRRKYSLFEFKPETLKLTPVELLAEKVD